MIHHSYFRSIIRLTQSSWSRALISAVFLLAVVCVFPFAIYASTTTRSISPDEQDKTSQLPKENQQLKNQPEKQLKKKRIWKSNPQEIFVGPGNRLPVIYHQDTTSNITILRIFINGGQKVEPEAKKGLAFITTRLAIELTEPSAVRKLASIGSTSYSWVEADHSFITIKCLTEHLEPTLDIFMKCIKKPLFSSLRIPNIKRNMAHRQKGEEDNPEQLMQRESLNIFFGSTGYSGSIYGDEKTRKKIKRKDMIAFYKRYFTPANMVVTVSTDLDKDHLKNQLTKHFESFPNETPETTSEEGVTAITPKTIEKHEFSFPKEAGQTLVSFSALLPATDPGTYTRAYLLEIILGDGIGSRLWPLRAQQNLAYYLAARVTHMKDAGILRIMMKTGNANKEKAVTALRDILNQLYEKGITDEELDTAKVRARASFLRNNETKDKRTYNLGLFETLGLHYDFLEDFFYQVDTITPQSFNEYIRKVLAPSKPVLIVVGPEE